MDDLRTGQIVSTIGSRTVSMILMAGIASIMREADFIAPFFVSTC